jgi:hypothetical protein
MPKTDYTDRDIKFPRLQVRLSTIDGETYLATIWLWAKAGGERHRLMNLQRAGNIDDAHQLIREYAAKYRAEVGPDDITVED